MNNTLKFLVMSGILGSVSMAWASDKPVVEPMPGQTAVNIPTPQPPQPESSIRTEQPPTPAPLKTDKNGVPILEVEFVTDHYDIPAAFNPQLNAFGNYLKTHPSTTAEITAHADNSGHGPANAALSQKRADAVFAYLVNHYALSATRIQAKGYGEITDKSDNSTAAAKQADRRAYGVIKTPKS